MKNIWPLCLTMMLGWNVFGQIADHWESTNIDFKYFENFFTKSSCLENKYTLLACISSTNQILNYAPVTNSGKKRGIFRVEKKKRSQIREILKIGQKFIYGEYDETKTDLRPFQVGIYKTANSEELKELGSDALKSILNYSLIEVSNSTFLYALSDPELDFSKVTKAHIASAANLYLMVGIGAYHYLSPQSEEQARFKGEGDSYRGLGIIPSRFKNKVFVRNVFNEKDQKHLEIREGDQIIEVEGEQIQNYNHLLEVLSRIDGDGIDLKVKRRGVLGRRSKKLNAKIVTINPPNMIVKEYGDVVHIFIKSFYEKNICSSVHNLLSKKRYKEKGIILDLRTNLGGLLSESLCLAGLFFGKIHDDVPVLLSSNLIDGSLTETKAFNEELKKEDFSNRFMNKLTVLVDGGSASASEIVAGIIKVEGRGKVVGHQTYGKGTVLYRVKLDRYKVNIRYPGAVYFLNNGLSPQNTGIVPDIRFNQFEYGKNAVYIREKDLYFNSPKIQVTQEKSLGNFESEDDEACISEVLGRKSSKKHDRIIEKDFQGDWELYYSVLVNKHCD